MGVDIKEQVVKNSFWNVLSGIINRVGSFIFIVLLSRLLLPEGFGKYTLALTISTFFLTFSDIGINQTLIRYVSLGIDKKNDESAIYFNYLFKIKFFITIILSSALLILAYPLSYYVFNDSALFSLLMVLSIYVFFISFIGFFESLFFIKKNVKYISLKESIHILLKLAAVFIIINFVKQEFRIFGVFLSFVIIAVLLFFFVIYFSKRAYSLLYKKTNPPKDKKGLLKFILFLGAQNISLTIISMSTVILLGIFLAEQFVGYYSSAWALITSISTLLFSFSYVLLPIYTNADEQKFHDLLKKTFKLLFILALPVSFGISLLSRYFIITIYGYDYLPASFALSILAFLIPCIITTDLALTSFSARDKQKKFSIGLFILAIIFLFLNLIFIKMFLNGSGESVIIGVSTANLISWLLCAVFSLFLIKKEFKIQVISFWILKPIFSCLIMSTFIFFMLKYFGDMDLLRGMFVIITGAIIYFSSLFLIKGVEKDEVKGIFKALFRIHKK